jgi:hypothetical protein
VTLKRLSTFAAIAAMCGYELPPGDVSRKVRDAATCARFPATLRGQVWYFAEDDLDLIATAMGMRRRNTPALSRAA